MAVRTRWIVVVAVAILIGIVLLWRGCRPEPGVVTTEAQSFSAEGVPVISPHLDVGKAVVRGTVHPGYTDWACILECREAEGCRAELRVSIEYLSRGEPVRLQLAGPVDVAAGGSIRVGRAQRPPVVVDRVERVTIEVLTGYRPGAPTPTPMD